MDNSTALNDLIEINNDRIKGYEKAATQTDDRDLKDLFNSMAAQSRQLGAELSTHVRHEGENPAEGTTARGKIYRTWMDVKGVFSGSDRKSVLNSCEFGEDAAQRAYATALEEDDLSPEVRTVIEKQKAELKGSHDKVRDLRNLEKAL